jgi:hypothetical protein
VEYDGGEWKTAKLHPRLLRRCRWRLLQRPAHPPRQRATNQAHRAPCRDLPPSRALSDPSTVSAENGDADQNPRALPGKLRGVL